MKTKLRAKLRNGTTRVSALINHPMTSGLLLPGQERRDDHCQYITEIIAEHNGNRVMVANWSGSIASNPFMGFQFKDGKKGDEVTLRWVDSTGKSGSAATRIA